MARLTRKTAKPAEKNRSGFVVFTELRERIGNKSKPTREPENAMKIDVLLARGERPICRERAHTRPINAPEFRCFARNNCDAMKNCLIVAGCYP
ncbi:hypothetical protein [Burkholderia ubonensis]|uniref:hypothetical protein n=1 Tax=Burkholderia ubonensis TaxID=101571 RepID=UPI0012F773DF|nr:hypothetical protein [Burkholderia ubonensis]